MTPAALDLILAGVAGVGIVLLGGLRAWSASAARRANRAAQREQAARRLAQWEARTDYQRGYAVVRLVRVARWDGKEVAVETEDSNVILPEEDTEKITRAQIEAGLRAEYRNAR